MPLSIQNPELFGVTESTLTVTFAVEDSDGPEPCAGRDESVLRISTSSVPFSRSMVLPECGHGMPMEIYA